jgi:hypothetical protein
MHACWQRVFVRRVGAWEAEGWRVHARQPLTSERRERKQNKSWAGSGEHVRKVRHNVCHQPG